MNPLTTSGIIPRFPTNIISIIIIISESWDVVINMIRHGGVISSLKSFLQLNICQKLQIFVFIYMYSGAG